MDITHIPNNIHKSGMRKETPVEGGDGKEFLFRHQTNQIVHVNKKNTAAYTPPMAGYTPPMAGVKKY